MLFAACSLHKDLVVLTLALELPASASLTVFPFLCPCPARAQSCFLTQVLSDAPKTPAPLPLNRKHRSAQGRGAWSSLLARLESISWAFHWAAQSREGQGHCEGLVVAGAGAGVMKWEGWARAQQLSARNAFNSKQCTFTSIVLPAPHSAAHRGRV